MRTQTYDALRVQIYPTRQEMGMAAALEAAETLRSLLAKQPTVCCIFAAAPSQNEFLQALTEQPGIEWERVIACHMDEYFGIPVKDPRSFSGYLSKAIFDKVPFAAVHLINGENTPADECARYGHLLDELNPDVIFMGIGENGHIAFNDPPVADFNDAVNVKMVALDHTCRMQQVHDGCFPDLDHVPTHALTVTVPALMRPRHVFCIVPGAQKAAAVAAALKDAVSESCPASILRCKQGAVLYIDEDCASQL